MKLRQMIVPVPEGCGRVSEVEGGGLNQLSVPHLHFAYSTSPKKVGHHLTENLKGVKVNGFG
jgi:hypothetical protein